MNNTAEVGAEMLVWLQIAKQTDKKITGVGAEVHDFAVKQVQRLLDLAKAQGV